MTKPEFFISKILESLPVPCLVLGTDDPEFAVLEVNPAFLKITNTSREHLLGRTICNDFPDDLYLRFPDSKEALEKVVRDKSPYQSPTQSCRIPGSLNSGIMLKYMDALYVPLCDDNQEVEYIFLYLMDVTEKIIRERHEINARKNLPGEGGSRKELRQMNRSSSPEIELGKKEVMWSDILKEIFDEGISCQPGSGIAKGYQQGKKKDSVDLVVKRVTENGDALDITLQIIAAKGNEGWLRNAGNPEIGEEKCKKILGILQDISDGSFWKALLASGKQFQSFIKLVDGIVWEMDARTFEFTFVSNKVKFILGYAPETWLDDRKYWESNIHSDDQEQTLNYYRIQAKEGRNMTFEYRMIKADGGMAWLKDTVSVIYENGEPRWLRGIMADITVAKRLAYLDGLEKKVLELNANNNISLQQLLSIYLEGMESMFTQMHFSILQVKGNRLYYWAAPSLPKAYTEHIGDLSIGENAGPGGMAAYLKKLVIVRDIGTDPGWESHRQLALSHQLRACWSYPILSSEEEVMAVFEVYYRKKKEPKEEELQTIKRSAAILKIILENRKKSDIIRETALLISQGQELANFGSWEWNILNNVVTWSDTLYHIYGRNKTAFKATFEGYQELLHPDDRERIYQYIQEVVATKKDSIFEERIIRPNGEVRHLKSWGKLQINEQGIPVKMIGACLDITESKAAELRLTELHQELEAQMKILALSEKQYSDLFHLSPQPMWIYELSSLKFLNVNDAAIHQYGYSLQEFLKMTIRDIRPEEEVAKLEDALSNSSARLGKNDWGIFKHRKKNGELIQVSIHSNIVQFDGIPTCIVLSHNITDRQNYLEAVEKQNKKLQEIAWIQSHVVRAPLARIMALIELLKDAGDWDPERMDFLAKTISSAHELDTIIKDISNRAEEIRLDSILKASHNNQTNS
ncbi:PAS domain-containing protein [Mucilaginibacter sp. SP1R1]|uniref:PAS domain-containing protein n=1 Tax=Mucilaginibacter sp. SP1R1 TaxID=2723091 RepID=UPI001608E6CC|nr:PAS domain-containing protein [Mucilaginibacter sp. SP1R1]MBB6148318.1 PAS domain S-box-containing protein [Mucilaginibacter sp. SP1R1]